MTEPKHFRTDRGTAAQSGAGDLSLLGAVPGAFAGSEASAAPLPVAPATDRHDTATSTGDARAAAHAAPAVAPAADASAPGAALVTSVITSPHTAGTIKSEAHDAHGAPPPAHGSGTAYVPAGLTAAGDHFVLSHGAAGIDAAGGAMPASTMATVATAAPTIAPVVAADSAALETIRVSVATLQEAIGHLTGQLPGTATGAVGEVLADAHDTVAALDDQLAAVGANAVATVEGALAAVDHLVAPVAPLLETTGGAFSGTLHAVSATTTNLLETVPAAIDAAHAITGDVATATDDLLGGLVTGGIAPMPGSEAVHEQITPLGGSDPAGGVATLVGLVSAADVFQLHDAGGDHAALLPGSGALGTADVLAETHPADALLGIADHHEGLLGGLTDHHDGLLGHGL